jgi:hypothetical protein
MDCLSVQLLIAGHGPLLTLSYGTGVGFRIADLAAFSLLSTVKTILEINSYKLETVEKKLVQCVQTNGGKMHNQNMKILDTKIL